MTTTDIRVFHAWRMGHPTADQSKCPGCDRPLATDAQARATHCIHQEHCPYMEWIAEEFDTLDLDEIAVDALECSCDENGASSPGSVESIRSGETDPWCVVHGVEDVRSGAYAAMDEAERRQFNRRLSAGLRA